MFEKSVLPIDVDQRKSMLTRNNIWYTQFLWFLTSRAFASQGRHEGGARRLGRGRLHGRAAPCHICNRILEHRPDNRHPFWHSHMSTQTYLPTFASTSLVRWHVRLRVSFFYVRPHPPQLSYACVSTRNYIVIVLVFMYRRFHAELCCHIHLQLCLHTNMNTRLHVL